jgi:tRNA-2-methylthio-N6-dimethylallyladenosine synthase
VPEAVKAERLQRVLALQRCHSLERNRLLRGQPLEVLVDRTLSKRESSLLAGRTRQNKIVHFEAGQKLAEGVLASVEITECTAHHLKGVLIASP